MDERRKVNKRVHPCGCRTQFDVVEWRSEATHRCAFHAEQEQRLSTEEARRGERPPAPPKRPPRLSDEARRARLGPRPFAPESDDPEEARLKEQAGG